MNKKGLMTVEAVFLGYAASLVVASIILTPSWRVNQYIEKCQLAGETLQACQGHASTMSQEQFVDYLRDNDMSTGNKGNFVNGYML